MRVRLATSVFVCLLVSSGCQEGGTDPECETNDDCAADEFCATNLCEDGVGECELRPVSCEGEPEFLVCGCDGRTYANVCEVSMAGERRAVNGPCPCSDSSECVEGQYCELDNSCLNRGSCVDEPLMCLPTPDLVCGCDGVDYESACLAAQAGARVSAVGSCTCDANGDCASDEYCNAITCDGPGECTPRQTDCPEEGPAITGCDGITYVNACEAAAVGVRAPCTANNQCGADDYCNGATCDGPGSCAIQPVDCPGGGPLVCGCNGTEYENACFAAQAGVRVDFIGECPCDSNEDCASFEFCDANTCDGPGECVARPEDCPTTGPEVIGCDQLSYTNECTANMAGVRVQP